MNQIDYWEECLDASFCDNGITVTPEQLHAVAKDVQDGHENYGMAFYSPPASDRLAVIEREWKDKYEGLRRDFEKYQKNAETAVKQALKQRSDVSVSIGNYGEVTRYDGRTERIQ